MSSYLEDLLQVATCNVYKDSGMCDPKKRVDRVRERHDLRHCTVQTVDGATARLNGCVAIRDAPQPSARVDERIVHGHGFV